MRSTTSPRFNFLSFYLILLLSICISSTYAQSPIISAFSPTVGSVGTLVTITGNNLGSVTAFKIGGVNAIKVSNNETTLVGLVMPGAVTNVVSVTTASGTTNSTNNFTVTPTPFPAVQQGAKLVGTGIIGSSSQAKSVYISADGNTAIVGGWQDNASIGAAWIYTRSGNVWTQQGGKLVDSSAIGKARQGWSVALSADGNTAIVGGWYDNLGVGAAWVYTRSNGIWTKKGIKLVGSGAIGTSYQGSCVALSADGNTAIVGADRDNFGKGAAWVYTRVGDTWTQQGAKLVGAGAVDGTNGAAQGMYVSMSSDGNTAIVGGTYDNNNTGAAWVYTRSGNVWTQQGAKLVGSGAVGAAYQGRSVAISADGNTAIVGGLNDNSNTGAAWVFTRSVGVWTQQGAKLVGTGATDSAHQGRAVAISADGNTAMVGGWNDNAGVGAAWVYSRTGGSWSQKGVKLVGTGNIGNANQGTSVSISSDGKTAIVGGPGDNNLAGAAWVFTALSISSFTPKTCGKGNTVTITGTNFTGATAVSFGGIAAASFVVVNTTTITAVVGAGASGNVSVTTPGGTATLGGFTFSSIVSQINQWTWIKGDSTINQLGIYGTQGTAAAANKPVARLGSVSWTDASGNLWLFGGGGVERTGSSGYLNDLWKYNRATNQWTWVKGDSTLNQLGIYGTLGTAAAANKPGARQQSVTWTDASGNLWLFGGLGYAASGVSGNLNDLWKYNPVTNQWTWMKGDNTINQLGIFGAQGTAALANKPGGRFLSVSWTDSSGSLWLFGGNGYAANGGSGKLNDLWKYNPATNQWTWVKGDNTINQLGVFGTQGTASSANKPGGISASVTWTDASGSVWLFGGNGYASNGSFGYLNDLWKYNLATNRWTWVKGGNAINKFGIYGSQGTGASANNPGGRSGSITLTDASGNLWFFGGFGYSASGSFGYLNDLWRYNRATNQWTWMKGDSTLNQLGIYGTQGTVAVANKPGGRVGPVSWTDAFGNLWLHGGNGYAANGGIGKLNDLWKYTLTLSPTITAFTPSTASSGATVTITGTNFTGATAVSFGGIAAASFVVVNTTTITAVVGAGASGNVSVTTPGGTATLGGFTFGCVSVSIGSVSATNNPICTNKTTTLSVNGVAGSNAIVTWWTGNNGTGNNLGTGLTLPNAKAGTYYARVTGTCGTPVQVLFSVIGDTVKPSVTCPANRVVSNTDSCTKSIAITNPTFADNCSVKSLIWTMTGATILSSPTTNGVKYIGSKTFNNGVTNITYTITDSANYTNTCAFTVTLNDMVKPAFTTTNTNQLDSVQTGCNKCRTIPNITFSDNCGTPALMWKMTGATVASGSDQIGNYIFNVGITTVTYTLTDAKGNVTTSTFTVTILDKIAPTITCPTNKIVSITDASCSKSVSTLPPSFADNCSVRTLTWTISGKTTLSSGISGKNAVGTKIFNAGLSKVTYIAKDSVDNSATCSFDVQVNTTNVCLMAKLSKSSEESNKEPILKAKIFHNPTISIFNLQIKSDRKEVVEVSVYNSEGKRVQIIKTANFNNIFLGEKYRSGSYLFEVRQGDKRTTVVGLKQ